MEHWQPKLFVPSKADAMRTAQLVNSLLTRKRVTSVDGMPVAYNEDGTIKEICDERTPQ